MKWWCRQCRNSVEWTPNYKVVYRWESLFVLQYICVNHHKEDVSFDELSFDIRMAQHQITVDKDKLEKRKFIDYHKEVKVA